MGGTDAQAQAAVLDLYDTARLKNPVVKGVDSNWDAADKLVKASLAEIATKGGNIRILTDTILSPSTKSVIADFSSKYANVKQVIFDATSYSGIINANKNSFDKAGIPSYKFDKAAVVVSFDADFLGSWISPVEFTKQYVSLRNHKSLENKKMSRHIQIETGLSMTGTNADARIAIKPSQHGSAVVALYNELATLAGAAKVTATELPFAKKLTAIAKELWAAKGNSLVISGSNDVSVQVVINAINAILGNYGNSIDLDNLSNQYQGTTKQLGIMRVVLSTTLCFGICYLQNQ
jgi:molybdopterin-containing oxidoreductase family iron-sulfur binding subunit